jgi:hypothetical protein
MRMSVPADLKLYEPYFLVAEIYEEVTRCILAALDHCSIHRPFIPVDFIIPHVTETIIKSLRL